MISRLLLPTALLLVGLGTACSKKEEPQPVTSASYEFDGQVRTCQASQSVVPYSGYDFLTISLVATPQPASGPETLYITLRRPTGQPSSAYEYLPDSKIVAQTSSGLQTYPISHRSPLPAFTSSGISGTFSGEVLASLSSGTVTTVHTIKAGTYTNVQP
jgi:hypothetical protein